MRFTVAFVEPGGPFVVSTAGRMSGRGFIAMAEELLRHPRFTSGGGVLFDHAALSFDGIPLAVLQRIRDFHVRHEERIGSGKSAIVVGPGRVGRWYALWSQGERIHTGNITKVFAARAPALRWLACSDNGAL